MRSEKSLNENPEDGLIFSHCTEQNKKWKSKFCPNVTGLRDHLKLQLPKWLLKRLDQLNSGGRAATNSSGAAAN